MRHPRLLLAALLAAAPAALAPASASADCPGALPEGTCAYVAQGQVGSRTGGVLRFPQAVAVGPDGSVYVADQKSHAVQVFGPDGRFVRDIGFAGSKPGQFTSIGGIAVTPDGGVIVTTGANRIDRFDAAGNLVRSWGRTGDAVGEFRFGSGGGNDAGAGGGIAVSDGFVYVVDTLNNRVQRFDLDGGRGVQLVAPGTLSIPQGIAVRRTRVLVADNRNHRIAVFDTGGRQLTTIGAGQGAGPGQLANPYDVAADASGRVFVADDLNHRVVRFSGLPDYVYKARWGAYGTAPGRLAYPRGIAVDAKGLVYVADTGNDRIDVYDNGGGLLRTIGTSGRSSGQFDTPSGVAADASGVRAVADSVNGRVQFLAPDGGVLSVMGSPNPGPTILPDPVATAFDAAGNAYVVDQRRSRVIVFSRATGQPVRTIGAPGSGPGQLLNPSAIAVSPGGTVWVADTGNRRLVRFGLGGEDQGSLTQLGDVRGVAVTPDGTKLYVSTASDSRIRAYDTAGNELAEFGGRGTKLGKLDAPAQLSLDAAGNVWVADRGNSRIQQFGPNGERLAAFGGRGTGPGEFLRPTSVSVDCRGLVTVTDTDNNRVQQFLLPAPPPGSACASLPPVAVPPAPKFPTLPSPDGPVLTVRALRTSRLLTSRQVPVRVQCDTACTVTGEGTLAPRTKPKKGKKQVVADLTTPQKRLAAGQSAIVRLTLTKAAATKLRKALKGRRGLALEIGLTATGDVGEPTSRPLSLRGTA